MLTQTDRKLVRADRDMSTLTPFQQLCYKKYYEMYILMRKGTERDPNFDETEIGEHISRIMQECVESLPEIPWEAEMSGTDYIELERRYRETIVKIGSCGEEGFENIGGSESFLNSLRELSKEIEEGKEVF